MQKKSLVRKGNSCDICQSERSNTVRIACKQYVQSELQVASIGTYGVHDY